MVAVLDYAWARYTLALGRRSPTAALWAMFLFGMGATVTRAYVAEGWTTVPGMLGAGAGTLLGMVGPAHVNKEAE